MRLDGFGRLSAARISQIEREYDISLPQGYSMFLQKYNGGIASKENRISLELKPIGEEVELEILFGIDQEDCFDIDYWMSQYREELPPHSLLIGNDTIKGFIMLHQTSSGLQVLYWDDERNLDASTDEQNVYLIANTFSEFLLMIHGLEGTDVVNVLPLGSVVLLNGGIQKMLIIARALNVRNGNKEFFFDYGAVAYPEGLIGDQMAYFNHENIAKVVFQGYADEDDAVFVQRINDYLTRHPNLQKGNADTWNTGA